MSESPLVPPPSDAGESGAPGEDGLPVTDLSGTGPQNAVAPGADAQNSSEDDDPTLAAPAGDPGGSASDLGSATDAGSLGGSDSSQAGSDPMPDVSGAGGS